MKRKKGRETTGIKESGYDSKLEATLHRDKLSACRRNKDKIPYTVPKTYTPDFTHPNEPNTLIEVKGRFRDRGEASKYIHFRKSNPQYNIVFIFPNPRLKMPGARPRKDGTKQSHAEWADKNGFIWYSALNVPTRYSE